MFIRFGAAVVAVLFLVGCGGGGSSPTSLDLSQPAPAQHGPITYTNPQALDPLPAFQALEEPSDGRFSITKTIDAGPLVVTIDRYDDPGYVAALPVAMVPKP